MVSPYNNPNAYIQAGMPIYNENETVTSTIQKQNSVPSGVAGAAVGAIGGGVVGYKKNPYINSNNLVSDTFTKKVHAKLLDSAKDDSKDIYNKTLEVLKKLDKIKSVEELKELKTNNPNIITANLENVKSENLAENIRTVKNALTSNVDTWHQETKNKILSAWDSKAKKFVKPENMTEEVFNNIKDATKGIKTKIVLKYATIASAITGTIAFALHKILTTRQISQTKPQQM